MTNEELVAQVIEQRVAKFSKLDSIVNNSGISLGATPLADTKADEFKQQLANNVLDVYYGMKHTIRAMPKTGGGTIVNLASIAGLNGLIIIVTLTNDYVCFRSNRAKRFPVVAKVWIICFENLNKESFSSIQFCYKFVFIIPFYLQEFRIFGGSKFLVSLPKTRVGWSDNFIQVFALAFFRMSPCLPDINFTIGEGIFVYDSLHNYCYSCFFFFFFATSQSKENTWPSMGILTVMRTPLRCFMFI